MEQKYLILFGVIALGIIGCGLVVYVGSFGVKSASGNTQAQACALLANNKIADDCYFNLAKTYNDPQYCSNIKNQTEKAGCISNFTPK